MIVEKEGVQNHTQIGSSLHVQTPNHKNVFSVGSFGTGHPPPKVNFDDEQATTDFGV